MKRKILLVISLLSFFAVGCSSIPKANPKLDQEAKLFQPDSNKSILYIYRNELMGGAISMGVEVDNEHMGNTRNNHYMRISLQPGTHNIMSTAENSSDVQIIAEPGKIHYVWQEVKMGIVFARTKLSVVDEKTGQKGVRECSLVEHRQPGVQASLH